jgi:hypothetical protein
MWTKARITGTNGALIEAEFYEKTNQSRTRRPVTGL